MLPLLPFLSLVLLSHGSPALSALPAPIWLNGRPVLLGDQVLLAWLPVPGAVKYNIYVNGEKALESPMNQYLGPAPEGSGRFEYRLTAVDASGAESPQSGPGNINVTKLIPPGMPMARAVSGEMAVTLRWNRAPGATVFNVYRAGSREGPWELLGSVPGEQFKDCGVEFGKTNYYSISSKDLMGRESERGAVLEMPPPSPRKYLEGIAGSCGGYELNIVATVQRAERESLGPVAVAQIEKFLRWPGGRLFAILPDMFLEVDEDLRPVHATLLNPDTLERFGGLPVSVVKAPEQSKGMSVTGAVVAPDKGILFTSRQDVFRWDPGKNEVSRSTRRPFRIPALADDAGVFALIPPSSRELAPELSAVVPLVSGGFWVADKRHDIWGRYDGNGDLASWFTHYSVRILEGFGQKEDTWTGDVEESVLLPAYEAQAMGDGDVFLNQDKFMIRMGTENRQLRFLMGAEPTMVGNFKKISGSFIFDDGRKLLVTDPVSSTMQVFDVETGDYIFSIGGEEAKADPAQPTRALIPFKEPRAPVVLRDGKEFGFIFGSTGKLHVLKVKDPVPVSRMNR